MQIKTEAGKAHEIKNPAIAFGIYGHGAKRLGDVAVTSKGLVWNNGKKASKDVTVKWDAFINWMQSQLAAGAKTAAAKIAAPKSGKPAKAKATKSAKSAAAKTAKRRIAKKAITAKKSTGKLNGRAGASKMHAISQTKPADKTAH